MFATPKFVSHIWCRLRVIDNHQFPFIHLDTIDDPRIVRRAISTPAAGLTLDRFCDIGEFEQASGARKERSAKVGEKSEGKDVQALLIDHFGQLLDLSRGIELGFITHQVVEWPRCIACDVSEVDRRVDDDCFGRHSKPGADACSLSVEHAAQRTAQPSMGQIVMNLEGQGGLPRTHCSEREPENPEHGLVTPCARERLLHGNRRWCDGHEQPLVEPQSRHA